METLILAEEWRAIEVYICELPFRASVSRQVLGNVDIDSFNFTRQWASEMSQFLSSAFLSVRNGFLTEAWWQCAVLWGASAVSEVYIYVWDLQILVLVQTCAIIMVQFDGNPPTRPWGFRFEKPLRCYQGNRRWNWSLTNKLRCI